MTGVQTCALPICEDLANFMAEFANTAHLDLDAKVYSDEENAMPSGSDAEDSDDTSDEQYGDSDGDDVGDSAAADVRAPQINRV